MYIRPRNESIIYRDDVIENKPVNLSRCLFISKSKIRGYYDSVGIPCITFHFDNDIVVQWAYESVSDRDIDFAGIAANNYKGA